MNRRVLGFLIWAVAFALALPLVAGGQTLSPELEKLNVSVGRWVFHGKTLKPAPGKTGEWSWNEDCRWSPNMLYLECTFSNVWSGKPVESLVVDAYNTSDHSYWHYELYASGEKGSNPFVSRMEVSGNKWIEYGQKAVPGKKPGERIVYNWDSATHVRVAIENSKDWIHWSAVDQGEGVKQE